MSTAASAENTMKFLEIHHDDDDVNKNSISEQNKNKDCEDKDKIFFKHTANDSDDDMIVIILEEDIHIKNIQNNEKGAPNEDNNDENEEEECDGDGVLSIRINIANQEQGQEEGQGQEQEQEEGQEQGQKKEKNINVLNVVPPKQKYIGVEVYTHLQHIMESQKMYPLLPCNMISSFACVMEYVEYFDIPNEERKKMVIDLVKILAYSNNDYGSRDCFEYFVEHNMIDDIIKTIIDSTKNRYDINRFPHTNRKIVLSCVSLSKKIKIVKPSAKIESLFEELKVNLCGLKRFFKMKEKEKEESKQT